MLSQKTRYALKALVLLADHHGSSNEPVSILELAQKGNLPQKFLEAILLELKRQGFLASRKGKGGGYLLAKTAEEIMIGDVVRALDGPLALLPCVSQKYYRRCEDCRTEELCALRLLFKEVRDSTASILDGTSLAKMCAVQEKLLTSETEMYFI